MGLEHTCLSPEEGIEIFVICHIVGIHNSREKGWVGGGGNLPDIIKRAGYNFSGFPYGERRKR